MRRFLSRNLQAQGFWFRPRSSFHTTRSLLADSKKTTSTETINVTFITPEGERRPIKAPLGKSILDLAWDNDVDLEGACEASLACSTCHVILPQKYYDMLQEIGRAVQQECRDRSRMPSSA
eukprot:TRINITY_DN10663_c0_g1_i3.p1 TRINITY_DN10663_c0_g1~~TRINITY_DN10663_c0_g1_i3.p1  ORF type:complete len:121 (+),score=18.85 TRINITY_DN10663_c0_g1_i3:336-698(+)